MNLLQEGLIGSGGGVDVRLLETRLDDVKERPPCRSLCHCPLTTLNTQSQAPDDPTFPRHPEGPSRVPRSPTRLYINLPVPSIEPQVREHILPRTNKPTTYQVVYHEEVTVRHQQILPVGKGDDWTPTGFLARSSTTLHPRLIQIESQGSAHRQQCEPERGRLRT
jgi:hypothetical protein